MQGGDDMRGGLTCRIRQGGEEWRQLGTRTECTDNPWPWRQTATQGPLRALLCATAGTKSSAAYSSMTKYSPRCLSLCACYAHFHRKSYIVIAYDRGHETSRHNTHSAGRKKQLRTQASKLTSSKETRPFLMRRKSLSTLEDAKGAYPPSKICVTTPAPQQSTCLQKHHW